MSALHRQFLQKALAAHQQGQIAAALQQYNAVLAMDPGNFDALQLKGLALFQSGDARGALELLNKAVARNGTMAQVFNNRGMAHQVLGQRAEALQDFTKALRLQPKYPEALGNKANVLREMGRLAEAREACLAALKLSPQVPQLHNILGVIRKEEGDWAGALEALDRAVALNPNFADAVINRANALSQLKRHDEALAGYDRAIALKPQAAETYSNRGNTLAALNRLEDALASHERAIALKPDYAEAYSNRGNVLKKLGRPAEALASCDRAIALKPDYAEAHVNRGTVLRDLAQFEAALACYDRALALQPGQAEAYNNRAVALRELGRLEEALASADRAIALRPDHAEAHLNRGALLRDLMRLAEGAAETATCLRLLAGGDQAATALAADWSELLSVDAIPAVYETEAELAAVREAVEASLDRLLERPEARAPLPPAQAAVAARGLTMLTGFYLAYHQQNDRLTMQKLSAAAGRLSGLTSHQPAPRRPGPLRIGIASQRLRNHNGANWAYNWFARLPRGDYEFFTYSFETLEDELAVKFAQLGTHRLLNFEPASEESVIRRMRGDDLDALMLTDVGMTPVSRFLSLHRIAPCQFTAWGHPVTTGSPEIDYYLSSDLMEPGDAQDHYSETLVRLPNLALYLEEEAFVPPAEKSFGLPEGRVLYGCLQSLYKYLPRHDAIYPQIAREMPQALFVFLAGPAPYMTEILRRRLALAFAAEGLDADRHVLILPRQSERDYDSLMRQMDVNIDSLGWSGGNTSLKSIAFGVPLLTMAGRFMRGRHSSAMFTMMGAGELIAASGEDYVARLVAMGREPARRRHAAQLLRDNAHHLYRDETMITAFDAFLKQRAARA